MKHLSPETLIDLAEGVESADRELHLRECDVCRRELADLKATLLNAVAADVPEPSPLFWDHLSARIKSAVEHEPEPRRGWSFGLLPWRVAAITAVAAGVVAVTLTLRAPAANTAQPRDQSDAIAAEQPLPLADDPSLRLISDLAGDLEWDASAEAGLSVRGDIVERAVRDLSNDERAELRRMLNEEIRGGV
jgi:hypothetical protein